MKGKPIFDPRQVAGMMQQHLVEELHRLQLRILLVERFGNVAVTMPMLGRPGTDNLPDMLDKHGELVMQIETLQKARDQASEADLMAFVASMKARR